MELEKSLNSDTIIESCSEKRKYAKLTDELKRKFIRKIVIDNFSIKQASELLRVNYSSAKAIISAHRKECFMKKKMVGRKNLSVCSYIPLEENSNTLAIHEIESSVGGLCTSTFKCEKKKKITKNIIISFPTGK